MGSKKLRIISRLCLFCRTPLKTHLENFEELATNTLQSTLLLGARVANMLDGTLHTNDRQDRIRLNWEPLLALAIEPNS